MVRSQLRTRSIAHGVVSPGRCGHSHAGADPDGISVSTQDAGESSWQEWGRDRPFPTPIHSDQGPFWTLGDTEESQGSERGAGEASSQVAARRLAAREEEAASVLYIAYARASGGYSPSWSSAPHRQSWLAAARAVLASIDEGLL